jgi:hypothetical protein
MRIKYLACLLVAALAAACTFVEPRRHMENRRELRASPDYTPWSRALPLIEKRCAEVTHYYQGHDRIVLVVFGDGKADDDSLATISPRIDQILAVLDECHPDPRSISGVME